ncbi:MAG: hypothetical protein P1R58_07005, partial [bacterium]|nr:hypothetical protein [bacterium]
MEPKVTGHDIGNLVLPVTNRGIIGRLWRWQGDVDGDVDFTDSYGVDCFTGDRVYFSSEFPKGSNLTNLWLAAYWFGGIVMEDTLVSTGTVIGYAAESDGIELHPTEMLSEVRSTLNGDRMAISEQDALFSFADTTLGVSWDYFHSRVHKPLGIEVLQKSYTWSYSFAEDAVFFDMTITNIGHNHIQDIYSGLYLFPENNSRFGPNISPNIVGRLYEYNITRQCGFADTLDLIWTSNVDGLPHEGEYVDQVVWEGSVGYKSNRHVGALMFLQPPPGNRRSFNWWSGEFTDFGPRHKANLFDFQTGGIGIPFGDRNRYHVLSNGEIDYDQVFTASIESINPLWHYPGQAVGKYYSTGATTLLYVLSQGSIDLRPGESFTFSFAYVMGENLHNDPTNAERNLPDNPLKYYENLDFSDLAKNAMWAKWIYDNPGYDTDGDGYAGKFRVCVHDSVNTDSG